MKNKTKIIIISIIFLVIILISVYFYIIKDKQKIGLTQQTAYSTQCTLTSCLSGYTEISTNCANKVCTRICQKTTPAACGTYGSEQYVTSTYTVKGANNRNIWYNSPILTLNSNYCWKTYANVVMQVVAKGSTDSYTLKANDAGTQSSACKSPSYTYSSVYTTTKTIGRGTGTYTYAQGLFTDYGSSTCTGGYPYNSLDGKLTVELRYTQALWVAQSTDTKTYTCSYQCDVNSDCTVDEICSNFKCVPAPGKTIIINVVNNELDKPITFAILSASPAKFQTAISELTPQTANPGQQITWTTKKIDLTGVSPGTTFSAIIEATGFEESATQQTVSILST